MRSGSSRNVMSPRNPKCGTICPKIDFDLGHDFRCHKRKETMNWTSPKDGFANRQLARRNFLGSAFATCLIAPFAPLTLQLGNGGSAALTKEQRDRMTPAQIIEELKKGNERFRTGKMATRDYLGEMRSSAGGQYP